MVRGAGRGTISKETVLTTLEWKGLLHPSKAPEFASFFKKKKKKGADAKAPQAALPRAGNVLAAAVMSGAHEQAAPRAPWESFPAWTQLCPHLLPCSSCGPEGSLASLCRGLYEHRQLLWDVARLPLSRGAAAPCLP